MTRLCLLRLLTLIHLSLLMAGMAQAHAVLQAAHPADNALLTTAPLSADLTFNEPVSPLAIRLIAPGGEETDLTAQAAGGQDLTIALPPLAEGTHLLS